jgi:septum formation protein
MLAWLKVPSGLTHADIDETPHPGELPSVTAVRLAIAKTQASDAAANGVWILGADTVVDLNGVSLGKPADFVEARAMVRQLREQPHAVHTGVALYDPGAGRLCARRVTTAVQMRAYTEAEIDAYVRSGDPMDKAGAYGIQNSSFQPVSYVDRCYANVVGFPLCAVVALLEAWGLTVPVNIPRLCLTHFGYHCPETDIGVSV